MAYFIAGILGFIGFVVYCWAWDSLGGATNSFWVVMCRVFAKNIKLALFLVGGFVLGFLSIAAILAEAGSGSETMTPYGRGPEFMQHRSFFGQIWHYIASSLAPIALLILVLSSKVWNFYLAHLAACNLALFGLYLVWLWVTVRDIVWDEYTDDDSAKWAFRSVAAIGTWAVVVLAAAWSVRWLFVGRWART